MKILMAVAGLVLVMGCAPDATPASQPGDESTSVVAPTEEDTDTGDTGDTGNTGGNTGGDQANAVSVELPGLPIGGDQADFTDTTPLCVNVNWTGSSLPDGAAVQLTEFGVPPQFVVDPSPCSSAPCLGGFAFTSSSGGCDVSVAWTGETVEDLETSYLEVTKAVLTCVDQSTCDGVQADIASTGPAQITLNPPFPDEASPSEDVSPPTEDLSPTEVSPTAADVTPTDG